MLFFNLVNYPYYIYKQITLYQTDLTTDVLVWKPLMGLVMIGTSGVPSVVFFGLYSSSLYIR